MDNYAGGKFSAFSSPPSSNLCNMHYDGIKQLNRLNVKGVSMNPSPIYEMHVIVSQKTCRKAIKIYI